MYIKYRNVDCSFLSLPLNWSALFGKVVIISAGKKFQSRIVLFTNDIFPTSVRLISIDIWSYFVFGQRKYSNCAQYSFTTQTFSFNEISSHVRKRKNATSVQMRGIVWQVFPFPVQQPMSEGTHCPDGGEPFCMCSSNCRFCHKLIIQTVIWVCYCFPLLHTMWIVLLLTTKLFLWFSQFQVTKIYCFLSPFYRVVIVDHKMSFAMFWNMNLDICIRDEPVWSWIHKRDPHHILTFVIFRTSNRQ